MDTNAVENSYARWAPIYDRTFGAITGVGRRNAVEHINRRSGAVLEVGVGTGLALPHYRADLDVTGIDYSEDMLRKARDKVDRMGIKNVRELRQMDAREIDYPDDHFDTVAAMHVFRSSPIPTVMSEVARVCKPGGEVVVVNHFKRTRACWRCSNAASRRLRTSSAGIRTFPTRQFSERRVCPRSSASLPPFGMMTFMTLRKAA